MPEHVPRVVIVGGGFGGLAAAELRVICVEAQQILGSTLHWRIVDANRGVLEEGHAELSDLAKRKPWDYGDS
jgi:cation diffusion facilitator CzcD-associated flavoprotein CzcO